MHLLMIACLSLLPFAPVKSQARAEFRNLRYEETYRRTKAPRRWDDELKVIPILPQVTLTISGQLRWREEFAQSYNFTSVSDNYGQSRLMLNADVRVRDAKRVHARVFAEVRDAQSYDRDLPGGTRVNDADRSDLQNLFAEIGVAKSWLRVGRQELVTGRERLIGVPDWSNTRRGMEGVRTMLVHNAIAVDAFDVRPIVIRLSAPNAADSATRLRALSLGSTPNARVMARLLPSTWQLYWYEQTVAATTPTRRLTTGARVSWSLANTAKSAHPVSIEGEAGQQRGAVGPQAIRAWFWTSELQAQWRRVRGAPSVAIGLEEASGDRGGADQTLQAFNALYAAAHGHGGYADVFGRTNARETHVISTWDPLKSLNVRGAWYRYDRLRLEDGVYNKQNTVLRAANGSRDRHAGDEIDLTSTANLTRNLKLIAGHAWVLPGSFFRNTPGGAHAERWGYAGTTYTF